MKCGTAVCVVFICFVVTATAMRISCERAANLEKEKYNALPLAERQAITAKKNAEANRLKGEMSTTLVSEKFLRSILKTPTQAKINMRSKDAENGYFVSSGTVTSQNSFGAMLTQDAIVVCYRKYAMDRPVVIAYALDKKVTVLPEKQPIYDDFLASKKRAQR
jgi:hypothetical protein